MATERKRATNRAWYLANTAHVKAQAAQWRLDNPEQFERSKRDLHYRKKYNITLIQYEQMFEAQGGVCAICGKPPGKHALHVDHNHVTGKVRGLLCFSCNGALGWFEKLAEKIRKYLADTG